MRNLAVAASAAGLCAVAALSSHAQAPAASEAAFEDEWILTLTEQRGAVVGLLELDRDGAQWKAWVEGGPVPVVIDGGRIELRIDSRDEAGTQLERHLIGAIENEVIEGTYTVTGARAAEEQPWSAVPARADGEGLEGSRGRGTFDLAGVWQPMPGVDMRKWRMDLTPSAEAWVEGVRPMDFPQSRCLSPGLAAIFGWPYPMEILESEDRITILYEAESEVRRVHMDAELPSSYLHGPMGYSVGRWENGTLVIETAFLAATVRDLSGEPISEDARIVERYTLREDGDVLSGVMTIHDPVSYKKLPIRRKTWRRMPELEILPYECDPDSFFRDLYESGEIDEYMKRGRWREGMQG